MEIKNQIFGESINSTLRIEIHLKYVLFTLTVNRDVRHNISYFIVRNHLQIGFSLPAFRQAEQDYLFTRGLLTPFILIQSFAEW